jgi:hypothetical protein
VWFGRPEPVVTQHLTHNLRISGSPAADHRRYTPTVADLLDQVMRVIGLVVIDHQLGKGIAPTGEHL